MSDLIHDRVKKNSCSEFGSCLHELRIKANLNLHGLAQKINSSPAWLSYLERGVRVPSWPLVEACVDAFERMGIPSAQINHFKLLAKEEVMRKVFVH